MLDAILPNDGIASLAIAGLCAPQKMLPPVLFYDAEGVRLFEAITKLPEYYLTRTEMGLLARIAPELAALAPEDAALLEYGASDEAKGDLLLGADHAAFSAYVPVDIASSALADLAERLRARRPSLEVHPICADFLLPLQLPREILGLPLFGFFPGSTIGNLDPAGAVAFLRGAHETLGDGAWLIVGADLRKSPDILIPAYDDSQGVTAAFNLNVLRRLNREAAANFDLSTFVHQARWNDRLSRIEMHLVSKKAQTVRVGEVSIDFAMNETIHTENSYKHSTQAFLGLAGQAGWRAGGVWTDPDELFAIYALRAD